MKKEIAVESEDVETLRFIFDRLKRFHNDWDKREDDPEDMWIEAPEMVADLVIRMEPVVRRFETSVKGE